MPRSSPGCAALLALLGALGAPREARAQAAGGDEMQVTIRGSGAGSFASTASADTSPREPVSAAALVGELPGVQVRRLGADGSFATLSVRGSASTQVGVVLGRIPLTSGADPSFDVGSLPLWPGASLKVHRGFAPASVGTTGYLGGVLVIEPPSVALGARTEWWTLGGSLGTLKLRAGDLRRVGDVTFATGVFGSRTDGDFTYPVEDPRTGATRDRVRANAAVASAGGIERVSIERSWGTAAATALVDTRRQGLPGSRDLPARFASLETTRLVGGLEAVLRTGARGGVHAALFGRHETATLADPRNELDPTRSGSGAQAIDALGGSLGWRGRPVDPLTLDLFVDGRGERLDPSAPAIGSPDGANRLAGGLGAELEWRAAKALTLAGSGRIDARRDEAYGTASVGQAPFGDSTGVAPSGHVGAALRLSDGAVLAAHAGGLERPPGFVELYGARGVLVGDPSLRSERAVSADAGVRGELGDGGAHLVYELVGFATEARDLIAFLPVGVRTLHATNIDRARILGVEASIGFAARHLATRASYTYLHTENEAESGVERGRPLPGRPAHDLVYDATYSFGPARLRYGLDVVTGTTVDGAGAIVLPPRVFHGLGASVGIPLAKGSRIRLGVQIDNLLDERALHVAADSPLATRSALIPVSDFLGFPMPGRTVWATARFVAE